MTTKIIVNGAKGRMGQVVSQAIKNEPSFELVAAIDYEDDLRATIKNTHAQVVIDFTTAQSVFKNTETIIEAGAHPVIGATGLTAEQIQDLQKRCAAKQLGGIIVPNFSISAVLMMKYAAEIGKYFPDVEIIEMHHNGKLDSPSGTAIKAADMLHNARHTVNKIKPSHETIPGARGALHHDIPIHAVRLPGLVAHLQIMFGGMGETLTLRHDSIDRQCFMPGVILACKKVLDLQKLVYGLEEIL